MNLLFKILNQLGHDIYYNEVLGLLVAMFVATIFLGLVYLGFMYPKIIILYGIVLVGGWIISAYYRVRNDSLRKDL